MTATMKRKRRVARAAAAPKIQNLVAELRVALGRRTGKPRATRDETAKALRVSSGTVFNWEHGLVLPTKAMRERLETAVRATAGMLARAPRTRETPRASIPAVGLAAMAEAIATCGDIKVAEETFKRAVAALA